MPRPITSQTPNRIQVSIGRPSIKPMQQTIESSGVYGENGTRNPRARSGCVCRKMITPADTIINANRVPILDKSASVPISQMPAGTPTAKPASHVLTCGVRYFLCTLENTSGSNLSRDIANQIRAWPYWYTSKELSIPSRAPTVTVKRSLFIPMAASAVATGEALSSVFQLTIAVKTKATDVYSSVHTINVPIMPIGILRCGLRHSSAAVETESKPINVKNTIAAPLTTPAKPLGK